VGHLPAGGRVLSRLDAGRDLVLSHRGRGELVELVLPGTLRPPLRWFHLANQLERFLGVLGPGRRVVVLTNQRLLVLPRRAGGEQWYDVQLDRRGVRAAGAVRPAGRTGLLDLDTRLGPMTLTAGADDARRMAALLG
jgi:hypothetical protein